MSIPVLIIAFQREANVRNLIQQLASQGVKDIYLAIDGPKNTTQTNQRFSKRELDNYCANFGIKLYTWFREINLGPAVSVISAIDWFFTKEKMGLILEDDLVLSSSTIKFFAQSLNIHAEDQNVFMISGTAFGNRANISSFVPWASYPIIWGWATWANRWDLFRSFLDQPNRLVLSGLHPKEETFWKNGLRRCLNGIQDAWDIPLANFQLSRGGITITSPVNLISNIGSDEYAGNTHSDTWPIGMAVDTLPDSYLKPAEFRQSVEGCYDSTMRQHIYQLDSRFILPELFSWLYDFIRFPRKNRLPRLESRLRQVQLPS
jgi:hypothetical protein